MRRSSVRVPIRLIGGFQPIAVDEHIARDEIAVRHRVRVIAARQLPHPFPFAP